MADSVARSRLSDALTSRRGAWISLGLVLVLMVLLFGAFGSAKAPGGNAQAPAGAESTRVSELLKTFPDADRQSVLVVASREDGGALSEADLAGLKELVPVLGDRAAADPSGPVVSEDRKAAVIITPITATDVNAENAKAIAALRSDVAAHAPAVSYCRSPAVRRSAPTSPRPSRAPTSPC